MTKKSMISMLAAGSLILAACSGAKTEAESTTYDILNASGSKIGTLAIKDEGTHGVELKVQVSGLETGTSAMHIHETGVCIGPDYKSAGGHFNPENVSHGSVGDGPHAGDMMNIEIKADGTGTFNVANHKVSLNGAHGLPALRDADGSALIIHAKGDDYKSQPSGAAGPRIACAVIPAG